MQAINRSSIKEIMALAGVNPTKNRGQNFLVDENTIQNIVKLCDFSAHGRVIEVGPGLGSLTYYLKDKSQNFNVIDIDERIICYLKDVLNKDVNIIFEDALKYDFNNYEYVVSNIPYNITTELITHVLLSGDMLKECVFMCQKENYSHFYDTKGSEYGPTSVLIHLLGDIEKQFDVKPSAFVPSPKCISTVFTIKMTNIYPKEQVLNAYKLAVKMFNNRRKTILNNLSKEIGREKAIYVLEKAEINQLARPEDISPLLFLKLSNIIIDINI